MKIVLRCFGAHDGGYGDPITCDCDYAVLEVTPELVDLIRQRCEAADAMKQADECLYSLQWWDSRLEVYSYDLYEAIEESGEAEDGWDDHGWCVLPESIDMPKLDEQRTELSTMEVSAAIGSSPADVRWQFVPKHSSLYVHTASITVEEVVEMLSMVGVIA